MKKYMIFGALLVAVILCQHTAATAEVTNRLVAIVNDDIITLHELNMRIAQMTGVDPQQIKAQNEEQYIEVRRNILNLIIDEKITSTKVRDMGITVTEEDVDTYIERIKKEKGLTKEGLVAALESQGTNYEAYRDSVSKQLERMQLIQMEVQSKIILSEEEIKAYYEAHLESFKVDATVRLASILLVPEDLKSAAEAEALIKQSNALYDKIQSGEDFEALAKTFSKGPGADQGGDLGYFKPSDLDPSLKTMIDGLAEGEITKPIASPAGIQIVKLVERQESGTKTLDAVQNEIRSALYKEEVDKRYEEWIKDLREKSYTKIMF